MKFTFEEVAPIYKKAIQEINRLNTEIEKFKSGERLSTFDDAETMGYLTYEANQLRQQSTVDNFRINELSVRNAELSEALDQLVKQYIDEASGPGENVTFQQIPVYEMTRHANGNTREQFMAQKWTDELLVEFGYMTIKYQYVRSN